MREGEREKRSRLSDCDSRSILKRAHSAQTGQPNKKEEKKSSPLSLARSTRNLVSLRDDEEKSLGKHRFRSRSIAVLIPLPPLGRQQPYESDSRSNLDFERPGVQRLCLRANVMLTPPALHFFFTDAK